jgi:sterol desaturase/sphingolipid hydroxylase (fatty acid hydroxylase superfamily)
MLAIGEPTARVAGGTTERRSVLDRLSASRANYWGGFAVDVVVSITLVVAGAVTTARAWPLVAAAVVAGVVVFSMYEYALHRWLYHVLPTAVRRIHARHHRDTRLLIGAPFFFSLGVAGLSWLSARCVVDGALAAVFAGTILGAYAYQSAVHHLLHGNWIKGRGYFGRLRTHHAIHHRRGDVNFGLTWTWWDRVLGTDSRRGRRSPAGRR